MPKITDKLTTQDGFNQALQVVGATNRAKIGMANRKTQGGVLGSLLGARSQEYGADQRVNASAMSDQTTRRGQDINELLGWKTQENELSRQNIQRDHYANVNTQATEHNAINRAQIENAAKPKPVNPLDAKIVRHEEYPTAEDFRSTLTWEQDDEISDFNLKAAHNQYVHTGELPQYKKENDKSMFKWNDDDYAPIRPQSSQQSQAPQSTEKPQEQPKVTGALLDGFSQKLGVARGDVRVSDDGATLISPDGIEYDIGKVQKVLGAR